MSSPQSNFLPVPPTIKAQSKAEAVRKYASHLSKLLYHDFQRQIYVIKYFDPKKKGGKRVKSGGKGMFGFARVPAAIPGWNKPSGGPKPSKLIFWGDGWPWESSPQAVPCPGSARLCHAPRAGAGERF